MILIFLNNKLNPYSLKLDYIFDLFNLTQHAHFPTHTAGNTLDYIISSSFTKPSISAESVPFSDHSLINHSFTIPSFPVVHFKINKRLWSTFNKDSFIIFFSQSSFDLLSFSDPNLFLTASNDPLLKVLMLFSLQRHPFFALLLLRLYGLIANAFLPKGLFGSLNDSTGQIVLQPHGTNGRRSYHPIEVFSTPSILPFSLTP